MLLGSQVEMEGYFFILFLGVAFLCGIIFIGYFQESNGVSGKANITGNFILNEPSVEVELRSGHIGLSDEMIAETDRIKKLIDDGNVVLYSIKN